MLCGGVQSISATQSIQSISLARGCFGGERHSGVKRNRLEVYTFRDSAYIYDEDAVRQASA